MQPESPEVAGMRRAPAVIGGVAQRAALDRLAAAGALHRGRVEQQQILLEPRSVAGEHAHQPLQRVRRPAAAFEVPGLLRQLGEQAADAFARDREKSPIGRDPHDRPRHAQRDELRVCDSSNSVGLPFRQEIAGRDEHGPEQQLEAGVHRGTFRSAMRLSTADLGPAARFSVQTPPNTATTVKSPPSR
jgi:hypothetical protein